jgi:hypothetical protein
MRNQAERIVCGQIIKERKRKACNDEVPAKKRKVTSEEIEAELQVAVIDKEAIENAFDELLSKRSFKSDKFVSIEHGKLCRSFWINSSNFRSSSVFL